MQTNLRVVTLDAETYYDFKDYSLKKLSATEYIRDERFQVIGWARSINGDVVKKPQWLDNHDPDKMQAWLDSLDLEAEGTVVVTQNGAGFDYLILAWHYGIVPWMCLDTLQMSRVLYGKAGPKGEGNSLAALARAFCDEAKGTEVINAAGKRLEDFSDEELHRYGEYCKQDVKLTYEVFRNLAKHFTEQELRAMSLVTKMSAMARIEVDTDMCAAALDKLRNEKHDRLTELANAVGVTPDQLKRSLMSNQKFAQILGNLGIEPPLKVSKTTGKMTFAFAKNDPEIMELLESDDEVVADVVGLRVGVKSTQMETRLQRFIDVGSTGPIPGGLRYSGAHTGRCSADGGIHKCQLQNLPSRGKEGKRNALRMSLTAPQGHVLCGADSSQIEVRVLAALAGEDVLLDAFEKGEDPYLPLGKPLFGYPITKKNTYERNITKAAVLAAGYKQGANGFLSHCQRSAVEIDAEMAERTINAYRAMHYGIGNFWKQCRTAIDAMAGQRPSMRFGAEASLYAGEEKIVLPSGRELYYNEISSSVNPDTGFEEFTFYERLKGYRKYIYDGRLTENIVQAVAYDVLMWQAIGIEDELGDVPVLFTHDELIYIAREDEVERYKEVITRWMQTCPPWLPRVPLDCEWGMGYNYSEV